MSFSSEILVVRFIFFENKSQRKKIAQQFQKFQIKRILISHFVSCELNGMTFLKKSFLLYITLLVRVVTNFRLSYSIRYVCYLVFKVHHFEYQLTTVNRTLKTKYQRILISCLFP